MLAGVLALRGAPEEPDAGVKLPSLPATPRTSIAIGDPIPLGEGRDETRWAVVGRAVEARARPAADSAAAGRLESRTPEGTSHLVPTLARAEDDQGRLWVRVRLPELPNGRTGWVPRAALGGYGVAHTRLVVDRERLTATLLRDGRSVLRVPVAVGRADAPTPAGEFIVRNRLTRYRSATYGPVAFGTSARSATVTDWPGGGFVGLHGTDRPELIPGRVSHGCIRFRNADIRRLDRLMPVGTPLQIR